MRKLRIIEVHTDVPTPRLNKRRRAGTLAAAGTLLVLLGIAFSALPERSSPPATDREDADTGAAFATLQEQSPAESQSPDPLRFDAEYIEAQCSGVLPSDCVVKLGFVGSDVPKLIQLLQTSPDALARGCIARVLVELGRTADESTATKIADAVLADVERPENWTFYQEKDGSAGPLFTAKLGTLQFLGLVNRDYTINLLVGLLEQGEAIAMVRRMYPGVPDYAIHMYGRDTMRHALNGLAFTQREDALKLMGAKLADVRGELHQRGWTVEHLNLEGQEGEHYRYLRNLQFDLRVALGTFLTIRDHGINEYIARAGTEHRISLEHFVCSDDEECDDFLRSLGVL